ncbi:MAG TPA: trypsin-like peptidase domain-containing protein [Pseudolysinimonas sp.]|nr:trypsin-like peptidase domain-containing protein [Pseudolysinimonas sp.]
MTLPAAPADMPIEPQRPDASPRRRHRLALGVTGGALALLLLGGAAVATTTALQPASTASGGTTLMEPQVYQPPAAREVTPATGAQTAGVVTITTDLYYGQGAAAGTGIILSSDGTILTNNHVVEGSTSIQVTVESTGVTYAAQVVGTDPVDDIAVIRLADAAGLTAATLDHDVAATGDTVTSVGNAGGTGDLVAASGPVTGVGQSITVHDELTGAAKRLTGLIEVGADVVSGDSGGPLLDAGGQVTGIVTAASSGSQTPTGYAIPIATALDVAQQILAGDVSGNVSLGVPAFLGVTLAHTPIGAASSAAGSGAAGSGAVISGVVPGLPADRAGLGAGDTITAIDGTPIGSYDDLSAVIAAHEAGDTIRLSFTDAGGAASTVTLTLVGGPAE